MVAWSSLLPLAGLALSSLARTAVAQESNSTATDAAAPGAIIPGQYILELEDGYDADAIVRDLNGEDIETEKRKVLKSSLFNGCSINLKAVAANETDADAAVKKIADHAKVKKIWPVRVVSLPNDRIVSVGAGGAAGLEAAANLSKRQVSNETYAVHIRTQVDKLHKEGITGKGMRIAIVDSGIDYRHPALGGCFGPGCKVSFGYDLVGDDLGRPGQFPDDDPSDCAGHGTHVAGIIGASPNELGFLGVAPDAELGAFKALNCIGYSNTEMLANAFIMAYESGADVISSSTGQDVGWPDDAWSTVASRIAQAGVPIVIAAGNSGEQGLWRPSSPATGHGVGSVASIDNDVFTTVFLAGESSIDGGEAQQLPWLPGSKPLGNLTLPLVLIKDAEGNQLDACQALPESVSIPDETIVLVQEWTDASCKHAVQLQNIAQRGGKNVLIYGRDDTPEWKEYFGDVIMANVGVTTQSQGNAFVDAINAGSNVTVTTLEPKFSLNMAVTTPNTATGDYTSYFTSWGPSWEMDATPNLAAHGGEILSTYLTNTGNWAVLSGTSMATPYMAGALALLAQKRGVKDSETLRAIMASTSKQLVYHDGQKPDPAGRLAPVLQVGPGMLQVWDASEVKGVLSTTYISFNDTANIKDATFSLKNTGSEAATYEIGHRPAGTVYALDTNKPGRIQRFPPDFAPTDAVAELSFAGGDVVTVPAGGSVEITVSCKPPTEAKLDITRQPFYSGFITLNGTNGDALNLQYMGLAGTELRKTDTILVGADDLGLPLSFLAQSNNNFPYPVNNDTVFRIPRPTNPPTVLQGSFPEPRTRLLLGTRKLLYRIVPMRNGTDDSTELPPTEEWFGYQTIPGNMWTALPRDLQARGLKYDPFYGLMEDGNVVPEGRYKVLSAALKLFGDWDNKEDWNVVELGTFFIQYTS